MHSQCCWVLTHGSVFRWPTLHFCYCQVMESITAQGRYKIQLHDSDEELAVKPSNLIALYQPGTYNSLSWYLYSTPRVWIPPHSSVIHFRTHSIDPKLQGASIQRSTLLCQEVWSVEATVFGTASTWWQGTVSESRQSTIVYRDICPCNSILVRHCLGSSIVLWVRLLYLCIQPHYPYVSRISCTLTETWCINLNEVI